MRRHVLLFGLLGGVLIAVLQLIEYRWLVLDYSLEIYGGLVAALFASLGLWLGLRLTKPAPPAVPAVVHEVVVITPADFVRDESMVESLGITPRELDTIALIAERVHVSENTVKTHSSRLFDKIGAYTRPTSTISERPCERSS